jgi:hypothetical protein
MPGLMILGYERNSIIYWELSLSIYRLLEENACDGGKDIFSIAIDGSFGKSISKVSIHSSKNKALPHK